MDPTTCLDEIRRLVHEINFYRDLATPHGDAEVTSLGYALTEHVEALDEWITKGGHLPSQWPVRTWRLIDHDH